MSEATKRGYGSSTTLWRKLKTGMIASCKVGRERRVSVADLDACCIRNNDPDSAYQDLVRRTVAQAPALSEEQRTRLAAILTSTAGV